MFREEEHDNNVRVEALLAKLPELKPDVIGKLVFELQLFLSQIPSDSPLSLVKSNLRHLIPFFKLPSDLIIQNLEIERPLPREKEKEKETEKEKEKEEKEALARHSAKLIQAIIQSIESIIIRLRHELLEGGDKLTEHLRKIANYYVKWLNDITASSLTANELRQLLTSKARLVDEYGNFYLLPQELALKLFGINRYGMLQEEQLAVSHAVISYEGMHFKSTNYGIYQDEGLVVETRVAREKMITTFYQLIAGDKLIASPSILIKLSNVDLDVLEREYVHQDDIIALRNGKTIEEILKERNLHLIPKKLARPLQVSYTIQGVSLDALITMWQWVNFFSDHDSKWLLANWPDIMEGKKIDKAALIKLVEEAFPPNFQPSPDDIDKIISALTHVSKFCTSDSIAEQIEEIKNILNKIDSESLSSLYIASILTNPSDGKTNNYMVAIDKDEDYDISLRIVGIDNDEALKPAIFQYASNSKEHHLEVKCCLYGLPQMDKPIHDNVRKRMLAQSPALFLLEWLAILYEHDLRYNRLIKSGVMIPQDISRISTGQIIDIPMRVRPGTILIIYHKLLSLIHLLKEKPKATHKEILEAVDPIVFYYLDAYMKTTGKSHPETWNLMNKTPIEELLVDKLDEFIVIEGKEKSEFHSFETLHEMLEKMTETLITDGPEVCTQPLTEMVKELIDHLSEADKKDVDVINFIQEHFSFLIKTTPEDLKIDLVQQRKRIEELLEGKAEKEALHLNLQGFDQLTKKQLKKIIEKYKNVIVDLNLSNCPALTDEIVAAIFANCKYLEVLNISHNPQIHSLEASMLKSFEPRFLKGINNRPYFAPQLRRLNAENCPHLQVVNLNAPNLTQVTLRKCRSLSEFKLEKTEEDCHLSLQECIKLKNKAAMVFLMRHFHYAPPEAIKLFNNIRFFDAMIALLEEEPEEIDLTNAKLDVNHIRYLAAALKINTSLKKLVLDHNQMTGFSMAILAKALGSNTTVTTLSVKDNAIGDSGAEAISKMLKVNHHIEKLHIDQTEMTRSGFELIVKAIQENSSLTALSFNDNRVCYSEGKRQIAKKLTANQESILTLGNPKIGFFSSDQASSSSSKPIPPQLNKTIK